MPQILQFPLPPFRPPYYIPDTAELLLTNLTSQSVRCPSFDIQDWQAHLYIESTAYQYDRSPAATRPSAILYLQYSHPIHGTLPPTWTPLRKEPSSLTMSLLCSLLHDRYASFYHFLTTVALIHQKLNTVFQNPAEQPSLKVCSTLVKPLVNLVHYSSHSPLRAFSIQIQLCIPHVGAPRHIPGTIAFFPHLKTLVPYAESSLGPTFPTYPANQKVPPQAFERVYAMITKANKIFTEEHLASLSC